MYRTNKVRKWCSRERARTKEAVVKEPAARDKYELIDYPISPMIYYTSWIRNLETLINSQMTVNMSGLAFLIKLLTVA
jgi:hypothetical protein